MENNKRLQEYLRIRFQYLLTHFGSSRNAGEAKKLRRKAADNA